MLVQDYWRFYLATVAFIIFFGGLLAPVLEVKLGVGGASGCSAAVVHPAVAHSTPTAALPLTGRPHTANCCAHSRCQHSPSRAGS